MTFRNRTFEDQDHPSDTAWMDHGLCVGMNPDLFFPERGASTKEAKDTCAACPVRAQCLAYGMTQRHGIWGGLSERERRRLRRSQRLERERGTAA